MNIRTDKSEVCLVIALCDPPGELLPKANALWPSLQSRFESIVVHATTDTHSGWISFLAEHETPTAFAEPNWDHIGLHRRRAVELGLTQTESQHFFYADPDHILRWMERDPGSLDILLNVIEKYDCLVVGRTKAGFAAAPKRLQQTESIVNEVYRLMTGSAWDMMMGERGLSRAGAARIVSDSKVDTLGNDVDWPLLIRKCGLRVGYLESDGLTYETNHVHANELFDQEDDDPASWMLRVYTANQHIDAMRPYLSS